jgi:TPP-dependent pyruvate/acetoin dehydrogenase alpha subunit
MRPAELFAWMARARAFEGAVAALWREGRISGEMHLGTGEEAVAAGVVAALRPGDAVALDHRSTPVLVSLGVDPVAILRELLGREDGLDGGRAGHMHLMSRAHLAAASGIVGSSAPLGAGFALAGRALRPGSVAVAFFGDGAMNQGMLLETLNLAVAWTLPLVLVCKDNGWAITTRSDAVTGGELTRRAAAFGLPATDVDGADVAAVAEAAAGAVERARRGRGPSFLRARVSRLDGHFLGDPLVRAARSPVAEGRELLSTVVSASVAPTGGGPGARARSVLSLVSLMVKARREDRDTKRDPLERARRLVGDAEAARLEEEALAEVAHALEAAEEAPP